MAAFDLLLNLDIRAVRGRGAATAPQSAIAALAVLGPTLLPDGSDAALANGWVARATLPDDGVSSFDPTRIVLTVSDPGFDAVGTTIVGDIADPAEDQAVAIGGGMRPLLPVRLSAARLAEGGFRIAWTRRSRGGWAWTDGGDVPVGEAREAYLITIRRSDGSERSLTVASFEWLYTVDAAAADRIFGPDVIISVAQIGDHALSPPATLSLTLA
jgi:hypothetical protein